MKDDLKGLYLAVISALVIIFVTNAIFPKKEIKTETPAPEAVIQTEDTAQNGNTVTFDETPLDKNTVLSQDKRMKNHTPEL